MQSKLNKKALSIAVGVAVLIFGGGFYLFILNDGKESKNMKSYKTILILIEGTTEYSIKVEEKDNKTWLYKNDEEIELLSVVPHQAKSVLTLPKTKGVFDIVSLKKPSSELTWESTLKESKTYLNFLEKEGYKPIRELYTSSYIEFIFKKEGSKKRVIVLDNSIMVGELKENVKLPDLESYISKYKTLGGLKDGK